MRKNILFRDICLILLLIAAFLIENSLPKRSVFLHSENTIMTKKDSLFSIHLNRIVHFDIYKKEYTENFKTDYKLLIFNDGQDLVRMRMDSILDKNADVFSGQNIIIVGIKPLDRMQEYGTISSVDFKGRGRLAQKYANFLINEFLSHFRNIYSIEKGIGIAGFSLGGLSAIDIALHHPNLFDKVGVFSGSFWWRSEEFNAMNPDGHRILIEYLKDYKLSSSRQQFWFQAGELDEESDRNNNGVIDAIDDTKDVISSLRLCGVDANAIEYTEVKGGTHSVETWGKIMPEFLKWWAER